MKKWTVDELNKINKADELRVAPRRRDGSLRQPVTIWVVRNGDDLFVRSYRGQEGKWYRGAHTRHEGHIQAGGVDKDVTFVDEADPNVNAQIDTAYRSKYRRHGEEYVRPMVAAQARATTMKLVPR